MKKFNKDAKIDIENFQEILNRLKVKRPTQFLQDSFKRFFTNAIEDLDESRNLKKSVTIFSDLSDEIERHCMDPIDNEEKAKLTNAQIKTRVEALTKYITEQRKRVIKYENMDFGDDELNGENYFTQLPKLRKSIMKAWIKREGLLGRSTNQMSLLGRGFEYTKSANNELNKIITRYYKIFLNDVSKCHQGTNSINSYSFFSMQELGEFITKNAPGLRLEEHQMIDIYDDLIQENKKRFRDHHSFDYYQDDVFKVMYDPEQPSKDPSLDDEELERKLNENQALSKRNLQDFKEKFEKITKESSDADKILVDIDEADKIHDDEEEEEEEDIGDGEDDFLLEADDILV